MYELGMYEGTHEGMYKLQNDFYVT